MIRRQFLQLLAALPGITWIIPKRWLPLWTEDHTFIIEAKSIPGAIKLAACSDGNLRGWIGDVRMLVKPSRFGCMFYGQGDNTTAEISVNWNKHEPHVMDVNYVSMMCGNDHLVDDFRNDNNDVVGGSFRFIS